jgi:precorrin-3B methylase
MKIIEVNLGIGMNQIVPIPVKIAIHDDATIMAYENYISFLKTKLETADPEFVIDVPNEPSVRAMSIDEFYDVLQTNTKYQTMFK